MQGKLCCTKRNKYDQILREQEAEVLLFMKSRERLRIKDVNVELSRTQITVSKPSGWEKVQGDPPHLYHPTEEQVERQSALSPRVWRIQCYVSYVLG
jgi:hypothetical protein